MMKQHGKDKRKQETMDWDSKLIKIQSIITMWKIRNLMFYVKIVIITSVVISQVVYAATVVHVPEILARKLEK